MEASLDIDLAGLVMPEQVEIEGTSEDGRSAEFVMRPLEPGFGHTLGNSVRRALLSSLRGSAVWAFRIEGVLHEHQTIQGVVEDVHQIIQNLKNLVVTLDEDVAEATLEIRVTDKGPVTAADITPASGVTIYDPGHHIMTLQDKRKFNIELHVNKGRGFVLASNHRIFEGAPVDLICIDAIYNPVRRANFSVEETRVGQRTDFDRLSLFIETDGSIEPDDAVGYAAELVRKHLELMLYFAEGGPPQPESVAIAAAHERMKTLFDKSIEELGELSVRSRNSLQKENIQTLGDLVQRSEDEMLAIENFGKKSLKEISDFLNDHELDFGMTLRQDDDGRFFFIDEDSIESDNSSQS
tara:strand:- start:19159 stop:20217 length:1059 start_codon:yes stop_codon:yes gene_type:complete